MGLVYEAIQEGPERRVALKVMRPGRVSAERSFRFQKEVAILGRLRHPGIATLFEGGALKVARGVQPYLAMELVQGRDVLHFCSLQQLSIRERIGLLARIADAVGHAHERGVVHRDLKPDNILVTSSGRPKILDFGVAGILDEDGLAKRSLTVSGELLGTLAYMSPEQLGPSDLPVTAAADVYALGILGYEMFCGQRPLNHGGQSLPEAIDQARTAELPRLSSFDPSLRGDLDVVITKAVERTPSLRYQDAGALAVDLHNILDHQPITARAPGVGYRMLKFARRHRAGVAVTVTLFAVLATSLFNTWRSRERQRLDTERARQQLYRASISAANYAISLQDTAGALSHLQSIPEQARGWEWHHVNRALESWLIEYESAAAPVGSPVFMPSGLVAVALDDGTVALWNPGEARPVNVLTAGKLLTTLAQHQPAGRLLAGTARGEVLTWDLATGRCATWDTGLGHAIEALDWAQDGTIAVYSDHGALVSRADGTVHRIHPLGPVQSPDVALNPTGTRVATFERHPQTTWGERANVVLFDTVTGDLLQRVDLQAEPVALEFSPDGSFLAVGDRQRSVLVLDAQTLEPRRHLLGHMDEVTSLAFAPNGKRLVTSSTDGCLRLWDLELEETIAVHHHGWDGAFVTVDATGESFVASAKDGAGMRRWPCTAPASRVLEGHSSYLYSAVFSQDGSLLASTGFRELDPTLRVWDPLTGEALGVMAVPSTKTWAAFSADDSRLIFGGTPDGNPGSIDWVLEHLIVRPGEEFLAGSYGLTEWRRWQQRYREQLGHAVPRDAADTGYSRDGELLARRVEKHQVEVRLAPDGDVVAELHGKELFGNPTFSPDGELIACASEDHNVYVWEWRRGPRPRVLSGHTSRVYGVSFHPAGRRLASCGNDNRILLWDTRTFEKVVELVGHTRYVYGVEWSPDGTMLASASGDFTVRLWDSVPAAERFRQVRAAAQLRDEFRSRFEGLDSRKRESALAALRQDSTLTPAQRVNGMRVLRELASEGPGR